jgi:general secretion pathway protein C
VIADKRRMELVIVTATLSSIAVFVGQGSSQLLASSLFAVPDRPPPRAGSAVEPRAPLDGCALLEENQFFDSALVLSCDGPEPPPPPPPPPWVEGSTAECEDAGVRLVGAYVRRGDAEQSFAAISHATGATLLYREGMHVGDRSVVSISESSVLLASETGARCTISMFEPRGPQLEIVTDGDGFLPVRVAPDPLAHIEQLGDGRYAIDRSFVRDVITQQAWPMVRVVPHEESGAVVGVRMFGVRRDSVLGQLGIQNGDSLRTVDGHEVLDPTAALEAYARLTSAERVTVGLVRRGQPMTLEYVIR